MEVSISSSNSYFFQAALEAPRVLNLTSNEYFSGPYGVVSDTWNWLLITFFVKIVPSGWSASAMQGRTLFSLLMTGTLLFFPATWKVCTSLGEFTKMQRSVHSALIWTFSMESQVSSHLLKQCANFASNDVSRLLFAFTTLRTKAGLPSRILNY